VNWFAIFQWWWGYQVVVDYYFQEWNHMGVALSITAVITFIRVRLEREEAK
jgi:hypothetical protein